MLLNERRFVIPLAAGHNNLLSYLSEQISNELHSEEIPVRFAITNIDMQGYHCELGIISHIKKQGYHCELEMLSVLWHLISLTKNPIFDYNVRNHENTTQFNAVLLIPTGIGSEIGGHSGDGGALARLIAATCDNLIIHPNVVNASDINELPENALYVEGSVITRLLMGTASIQRVRSNRVMLVIDENEESSFHEAAVNAASAARAALGLDCPLVVIMNKKKIFMQSIYSSSGRAVGQIKHLEHLCEILEKYRSQYDAVALSTYINLPPNSGMDYFNNNINVNPWGGVEAMLTHAISMLYDIPSAHSPMMSDEDWELEVGIVDPRKSAEAISLTNLHCILKGLHKSPRIINSLMYGQPGILTVADISCLVIPYGCIGLPTLAALEQGIPVIAVRENKNLMQNKLEDLPFAPDKLFIVDNYLEAVGLMKALKAGVAPASVRRPLAYTNIKTQDDLIATTKK